MRVAAAVCCPDGKRSGAVLDWLGGLATVRSIITVEHRRQVAFAENLAVQRFLRTDLDALWFVANDLVPYKDTARVLEVDADIALGWSFMISSGAQKGVYANVFRERADSCSYDSLAPSGFGMKPREVDAGGMHCALIRRRVFCDAMRLPRTYVDPDGAAAELADGAPDPYFRTVFAADGSVAMTDDFDFCRRAKRAGFSVAFHPLALSGHEQTDDIVERVMLAQQAASR